MPGVIGVTLRQSFFQRRSGLLTVTATTAAGAQHYEIPDVPQASALALAAQLVPETAGLRGLDRMSGAAVSSRSAPGTAHQPAAALLRDGPDVSRLPA